MMTLANMTAQRGFFVPYRPGEPNRCPGCGRSQWWIGRIMAECAFCRTALDLPDSQRSGSTFTITKSRTL